MCVISCAQIVAAVNGPAIGIGVTLLPHCDVVFASTTATFWTPFARIAVVPEFCSSYLFPMVMVRISTPFQARVARAVSDANDVIVVHPAGLVSRERDVAAWEGIQC